QQLQQPLHGDELVGDVMAERLAQVRQDALRPRQVLGRVGRPLGERLGIAGFVRGQSWAPFEISDVAVGVGGRSGRYGQAGRGAACLLASAISLSGGGRKDRRGPRRERRGKKGSRPALRASPPSCYPPVTATPVPTSRGAPRQR